MRPIQINDRALQEARSLLTSLGSGGKSGPTFEETMAQDQQKAQEDSYREQMKLRSQQDNERMKLGAKMEEAVMKNDLTLQQSRESNALDMQKHKLTTEMQAQQPQYTAPQGGSTAQTAVSNQYDSNQVPRYLGNNFS